MGRKVTDGGAIDVEAPATTLIEFGELYRMSGITGIAMDQIDSAEVDKSVALDVAGGVWDIKTPTGIGDSAGQKLFWSSGSGFKKGDTNLAEAAGTAGDLPVAVVVRARNANGYTRVKVVPWFGPVA